jgi:hypothetical protein
VNFQKRKKNEKNQQINSAKGEGKFFFLSRIGFKGSG